MERQEEKERLFTLPGDHHSPAHLEQQVRTRIICQRWIGQCFTRSRCTWLRPGDNMRRGWAVR